jgi:xanthine dehydrogenase accessory factor
LEKAVKEIFQTAARALRNGQSVALATVVRSIGSTPRHAAAKMVIQPDGSFVGTIGGGSMEHKAIQDALATLASGEPALVEYPLIGKTPNSLGLCGGTQEVFIDLLTPASENGPTGNLVELCETIALACEAGEPAALVTVVQSYQGGGWHVGEKTLIRYDMSTYGQLGGEELEPRVLATAQQALRQNRSIRLGYQPKTDTFTQLNSLSREPLELFVDVVQPRPELMIIGAGHIGLALAELGCTVGMRVVVVDDRQEWADRFPQADETIIVPYEAETEILDLMPITITPTTSIVVATWGWDEPALAQVAASPAPYVGLVASRRKAKIIFDGLQERDVPREALARVRVPAGLDLGAETPEEIALSIMAEILLLQRGATGRPMMERKGHPLTMATGASRR